MDSNFNRYAMLTKDLKFWIAKRDHAQRQVDRIHKELKAQEETLSVKK